MPNKPKRRKYRMFIDEEDVQSGVYAISLVESPAIEENWVYLSKHYKIELAEANNEKRLLIGPVLIPNKEIPRIDPETGEEYDIVFDEGVIEKAAQLFLQRQHNNDSTLEHDKPLDDVSVVESWVIANEDADKSNAYGLSYPKGTWMVMAKVNNDEIWSEYVKTGKVKGFSLEGLFGHNLIEASKQTTELALSALLDTFDNEYAEEMLSIMKGIIKYDGRLKEGKRVELETYNDYPDTVKNAAKRGIALNEKVGNKCATDVGKIRAQQLANGRNISVQTIKRMYAYTSRAREFYNPDDTTACGTISYLLWGGDAANRWSAAKLKELGLFEGETAVSVSSSYAGQFGPTKKARKPRYRNFVDTQNMEAQFISGPTSAKDKKRFPGNRGTMFFPYIAPALLEEVGNMDIYGYMTQYFQLCPGAQMLFKQLVEVDGAEEIKEAIIGAAMLADKVFQIENDVLEAKKATEDQYVEAYRFVEMFDEVLDQIEDYLGIDIEEEFMDNHLETIAAFIPVELAEVGPRGGIKESPKAPKSDTKNPEPKGQGTAGGSAAGKRGAEVSREDEKTLADKAEEFNAKESNTKYGKANMGALKSVFQRGLGAYNTSRSPEVAKAGGARQWALARVNAFLYLLKNGRPQNAGYTTDYDLLPKGHPKAE